MDALEKRHVSMTVDGIGRDGNIANLLDIVDSEDVGTSSDGSSASRSGSKHSFLWILLSREVAKELLTRYAYQSRE